MKPFIRQTSSSGNTLLIALMVAGMLSLSLISYLALTSTESQSVFRSRDWNAALPLAEAGIEEAFSQISRNANDYSADGWGTNYSKIRYFGNDRYAVGIV